MQLIELREGNHRVVCIHQSWAVIHRIEQLPQLGFARGNDRRQHHEGGLRRHDTLVKNFVAGWFVMRDGVQIVAQFRERVVHALARATLISERTMLRDHDGRLEDDQDPLSLFQHQVFDPVNVYPYAAADEVRRVTHYYQTTAAEIADDPFYSVLRDTWGEVPDNTSVNVYAFYWKDAGSWWHAGVASPKAAPT